MNYKLSTLEITPKTKAGTTSEVFISEPEENKEALAGKLFAIIEIESTNINALKIINFIVENIAANYYQDEKISLRETVKTIKVEHIFEAAIGKTNKELAHFTQEEKNKIDFSLINATIGVIYENNLYFANAGKNKIKLITPKNNGKKEYSLINIAGQATGEKKEEYNRTKLFTSVISGAIPIGGYVIFSNEVLPEYVSDKQMVDIVSTLPPQSATEHIKNVLSGTNNYVSFLGLIIKNTLGEKEMAPAIISPKTSTEKSVRALNEVEEKTEKLLSSGSNINVGKMADSIKNIALAPVFSKSKKTDFDNIGAIEKSGSFFGKRKINFSIFRKIFDFILALILLPIQAITFIFKIITSKEKRTEAKEKIKSKISNAKNWFSFLEKKNKITFIIVIVCITLLIGNLSWLYLKNRYVQEEMNYNELLKKIEQKQNQVEANLLYKNEEGAKKLLTEIAELLKELPTEDGKNKEEYATFYQKNNEQLDAVRHATKLNLEKIVDLSLNNSKNPQNIILLNNNIYVGDNEGKTIYSTNTESASTTSAGANSTTKQLLSPNTLNDNNIYYLNDKIVKFDTSANKASYMDMSQLDLNNIISAAAFNSSFYLLDKNNGQIWRLNKTGNSLSTPQSWLKNKADFSDAVDLDIDGSIYVLKKSGSVVKYFKGETKDFDMEIVEPELANGDKIAVSEKLNFVYILDSQNNRIIVYSKTGEFIAQYHSEDATDLKDFAIDENNKKIYLLNGSSVYKADLGHINIVEE